MKLLIEFFEAFPRKMMKDFGSFLCNIETDDVETSTKKKLSNKNGQNNIKIQHFSIRIFHLHASSSLCVPLSYTPHNWIMVGFEVPFQFALRGSKIANWSTESHTSQHRQSS